MSFFLRCFSFPFLCPTYPHFLTEVSCFRRYHLTVKDLDKSWRDGVLFNALIHRVDPNLIDMAKVRRQAPRQNLEQAFSRAEKHLGIPRLLEPEDVDCERPDKRSIMTYVSQFVKLTPYDKASDPRLRLLLLSLSQSRAGPVPLLPFLLPF